MSNWLWWTLASSVVVAIIIMITMFIITKKKINKIKNNYLQAQTKQITEDNPVLKRKNHGELLWDLKEITANPLGDIELEFAINTAIRNAFKTFAIFGTDSTYEAISFEQIARMKQQSTGYDFAILFNGNEISEFFDVVYQGLNEKGMVLIVNAFIRNKTIKRLLAHLKLTGIRHEHSKIGKGLILVVK